MSKGKEDKKLRYITEEYKKALFAGIFTLVLVTIEFIINIQHIGLVLMFIVPIFFILIYISTYIKIRDTLNNGEKITGSVMMVHMHHTHNSDYFTMIVKTDTYREVEAFDGYSGRRYYNIGDIASIYIWNYNVVTIVE